MLRQLPMGHSAASHFKLNLPTNLANDTNGEAAKEGLFVPFVRFVGNPVGILEIMAVTSEL